MAVTYSQNGTIVRTIMPTDAVSTRRIDSEQGINVVDENGYIGAVVTDYFPHTGNTYYNNFAIVINNADFSNSGLGQVTFITSGTTDIGGRTYRTVNIGGLEWLAENLDYKFSGCNIGGTAYSTGEPNAWYYNNDEATYGIDNTYHLGLMYNRAAVDLLVNNVSTLCPGWHIPTAGEWDTLLSAVGNSPFYKICAKNNSVTSNWPNNWNGTDDYGLGILPGSYVWGGFDNIGDYALYWTNSKHSNGNRYYLFFRRYEILTYQQSTSYQGGYLRLVKDAT